MAGGAKVLQAGEVRSARIESLRALAALSVLAGHVFLFRLGASDDFPHRLAGAGRYGVWLFFALTGYLLFWPFVRRDYGDGGRIDLRRYALNRGLRILPLYYLVVATLLVLSEHGGAFGQWWRFATFSESYFRSTVGTLDTPIWSLVVELQFYALLPLLAWALLRLGRGSLRRAGLLLGATACASLAVWFVKVHAPASPDLRWRYSLPATFFNFTPGMFLALGRAELERRPRRLLGSTALVLASAPLWLIAAQAIRWAEPLCALAALLVVAAVVLPVREGRVVRGLGARPLAAIGVASYSLYLWHVPLIRALNDHARLDAVELLLAGAALALAVAAASYLLVERPFLRLRRRWGPVTAAPAAEDSGARRQPEGVVVPIRAHRERA
jgi:acetyltransferase